MDELDYWRLCDELTVNQAAFLIAGVSPSGEIGSNCENWKIHERPDGYEAAKAAISKALSRGAIAGEIKPEYEYDINGHAYPLEGTMSLSTSTVHVDSLKIWLAGRGVKTGFFFPDDICDDPDYLDPNNPRYAPKLAAAVRAWQAMSDENLRRGKSAKSAMDQWLTANYKTLGLFHKRDNEKNKTKAGDMNKSAILEAAKIANWEEDGGAPKTPL